MRVVAICGGVGGARMALGLAGIVSDDELSVIVNVGDDERFHGLLVCPDLDTVLYTLAGVVDRARGWGVSGDETRALDVLRKMAAPGSWMMLGDADLGLHIFRSWRLAQGATLTAVTDELRRAFGVRCNLLPVSDDPCPTEVETDTGRLSFQEWFVRDRAEPAVRALRFPASGRARLTDRAREAMSSADLIVFAPSNPYLSIEPMLQVAGMREVLSEVEAMKVAVSPLIAGRAIKGPLVKLMRDLGREPSNRGIAATYMGLADVFVIDESDSSSTASLARSSGLDVRVLPTLIPDAERAQSLARQIIDLSSTWRRRGGTP
jgi:LPPG:FO 2-phospho-L-lactate transferase